MNKILSTLARINRALIMEAVEELQRRKLRTLLTLLGMIFGVGAIVAMLAVGEGSRREALRLVSELGLNNLIVRTKSLEPDTLRELRKRFALVHTPKSIYIIGGIYFTFISLDSCTNI